MAKKSIRALSATRPVESLIRMIRGQKVTLDSDLGVLYGITTGNLNLAAATSGDSRGISCSS